jgi:hypothetical protein
VKTIRGEARLTETNIQDALREVRVALLGRTSPLRSFAISSLACAKRRLGDVAGV